MAVVSPPSITALPTPPDPNDRTTFNTRAYPWSVAQQTLATQVSAVATNVFANATDAATSAGAAASSAAAATTNGAAQVALAAAQAAASAASAVDATNNGAAQVALATAQANISSASANYKGPWSSLTGALNMPASTAYNGVFWALNNNLANVTTETPGISSAWTQIYSVGIKRVVRSGNTILTSTDASKIISMTGTWTQTFSAASALGDGWFCYLQNSGTGDITLDPNASELIDGLTSYIMYPGEVRLVQCDGTTLTSILIKSFTRTFTASGTFIKPPGYMQFSGLLWGGGGSGSSHATAGATGGGGGACHPFLLSAAALAATVSVVIAAGGAGVGPGLAGNVGGTSTFGAISAYGGGGSGIGTGVTGATGGGTLSAGSTSLSNQSTAGGAPSIALVTSATYASGIDNPGLGGAGVGYSGSVTYGGNAAYGGASSGQLNPGKSIYGGGAGGSYISPTAGTSVYGGSGGNGSAAGPGTAGAAPAGGGGAGTAALSGAGGRGEMRIWGVM